MENKLFRNSVSIAVIAAMIMSVLALPVLFDADNAYASENAEARKVSASESIVPLWSADPAYNANYALNNHAFTAVVKPGKWNPIYADGHRYSDLVSRYVAYYRNGKDITKFVQGEEFFVPVSINVKGTRLNRTFTYSLGSSTLFYQRYGVELYSSNAGKYTITTKFQKYYVNINNPTSPYWSLSFVSADPTLYTKQNTFYVQTKVKLSYDKKKGKLAKKRRTYWKNPTTKYGKLPRPKAKRGYKFLGWYTKKKGGKKVKSGTKVPQKNAVTLYARYKKR